MASSALSTGIAGQDSSCLAELLLRSAEPMDYAIEAGGRATVRYFLVGPFISDKPERVKHVRIDPKCLRPSQTGNLLLDVLEAHESRGLHAQTDCRGLAQLKVSADTETLQRHIAVRKIRVGP